MGIIDIHSHILPALDDGADSLEQAVCMLQLAAEEGIQSVIATPHNMPGKGQPSYQTIIDRVHVLGEECTKRDLPIHIMVGTEYFYREEVIALLEREEAVTLNGSDYVLVEFDPSVDRIYFRNAIRDVMATGYLPVVAHVERYANLMQDISLLADLKKMGTLFQVNAASVIGDNGRRAKKDVKRLLKAELIDFVATDAHSDGSRAPYIKKCASYLNAKYGRAYTNALLFENAMEHLI